MFGLIELRIPRSRHRSAHGTWHGIVACTSTFCFSSSSVLASDIHIKRVLSSPSPFLMSHSVLYFTAVIPCGYLLQSSIKQSPKKFTTQRFAMNGATNACATVQLYMRADQASQALCMRLLKHMAQLYSGSRHWCGRLCCSCWKRQGGQRILLHKSCRAAREDVGQADDVNVRSALLPQVDGRSAGVEERLIHALFGASSSSSMPRSRCCFHSERQAPQQLREESGRDQPCKLSELCLMTRSLKVPLCPLHSNRPTTDAIVVTAAHKGRFLCDRLCRSSKPMLAACFWTTHHQCGAQFDPHSVAVTTCSHSRALVVTCRT